MPQAAEQRQLAVPGKNIVSAVDVQQNSLEILLDAAHPGQLVALDLLCLAGETGVHQQKALRQLAKSTCRDWHPFNEEVSLAAEPDDVEAAVGREYLILESDGLV